MKYRKLTYLRDAEIARYNKRFYDLWIEDQNCEALFLASLPFVNWCNVRNVKHHERVNFQAKIQKKRKKQQ